MQITKATIADVTELTQLVNSGYRGESSKKGWTTEANLLDGIRIDENTMIRYFQDPYITILKHIVVKMVKSSPMWPQKKKSLETHFRKLRKISVNLMNYCSTAMKSKI